MYGKTVGGAAAIGGVLPITGINVVFSLLIVFVLIGAGFALLRCLPKRHTS